MVPFTSVSGTTMPGHGVYPRIRPQTKSPILNVRDRSESFAVLSLSTQSKKQIFVTKC